MIAEGRDDQVRRITRREAVKRGAMVAGLAWSAPVMTSMRTPAFAASAPCEQLCGYRVHFQEPGLNCENGCVDFPNCVGECDEPNPCQGPGCARITSLTLLAPGVVRVCTDCQLGVTGYCQQCPDTGQCSCTTGLLPDPSGDPRCGVTSPLVPCANADYEYDIRFECRQCP